MSTKPYDKMSKAELLDEMRALHDYQRKLEHEVFDLRAYREEFEAQRAQLIQAQKILSDSRDRYADLYDFAPIAYVTSSEYGIIEEINLTGSHLLGSERGRILGMPLLSFVAPEDGRALLDHMRRCRQGEGPTTTEIKVRTRNGGVFPARLFSKGFSNGEDLAMRYRTAIIDLTEHKRAENERGRANAAKAANEAKDRFIAALSHELRTPLTPVVAAVTSLANATNLPRELTSTIDVMKRNLELETRLIDDLLDVTRIARDKLHLELQTTDMHSLISDVVAMCAADVDERRIELTTEFQATTSNVHVDATRLRQVIWNLLKNAIRSTPPYGKIVIQSVNEGPDKLTILVTDNGVGISPTELDRLFEPFEQGEAEAAKAGGLGLGLAISKGVIEAHGGRIWAASAGRNQGATFVVELATVPSKPPPPMRASQPPADEPKSATQILLVEDHVDTAIMLSQLLEHRGYRVRVVHSIHDAMAALDPTGEIVISDLGLPDGTGLDLVKQLRAHGPVKAIALSGYGTAQDVQASKEAGFAEHLTKPVDFQTLIATIERVNRGRPS